MEREEILKEVAELKTLIKTIQDETIKERLIAKLESTITSLSNSEDYYYFCDIEENFFEKANDKLDRVGAIEIVEYEYNGKINKWHEE